MSEKWIRFSVPRHKQDAAYHNSETILWSFLVVVLSVDIGGIVTLLATSGWTLDLCGMGRWKVVILQRGGSTVVLVEDAAINLVIDGGDLEVSAPQLVERSRGPSRPADGHMT